MKCLIVFYKQATIADQHHHQTNLNFTKNNIVLNVLTKNKAKGIYCNLTSSTFVGVFWLIQNYRVDL